MKSRETRTHELVRAVDDDPNAALELLKIAVENLKAQKIMPNELSEYLVRAFTFAISTPQPKNGQRIEIARIKRLAEGLGMARKEGRPRKSISQWDLFLTMAVFGDSENETTLKRCLVEAFKGTEHEIGLSTARTLIRQTKAELAEARKKAQKLMNDNGRKSLVLPRNIRKSDWQ